ncbi:MAG TPA: hypothetical protein PK198_10635 [Saprospiraceae bacterium]|jgi:hypothetical protein|nr:hypothetical protein [Saprospiraceae bacterium]HRK82265.1 hypothetical protein [Saprospiraceae bacterium]
MEIMPADKILIINGHPDAESYNFALAEAYKKGALASVRFAPLPSAPFGFPKTATGPIG